MDSLASAVAPLNAVAFTLGRPGELGRTLRRSFSAQSPVASMPLQVLW